MNEIAAFRRVVVALDASQASRRVLGAAAAVAAREGAELIGLFVEDTNLLHMGALPFTRAPVNTDSALQDTAWVAGGFHLLKPVALAFPAASITKAVTVLPTEAK